MTGEVEEDLVTRKTVAIGSEGSGKTQMAPN